jgi:hypothetical protein
MGACGSKTCGPLYAAAFRAAGVDPSAVKEARLRPLAVEVPLGTLGDIVATASGQEQSFEEPRMALLGGKL